MKLFMLNTFTDRPFSGNPVAVCFLEEKRDGTWMQQTAQEINLPVTAFITIIQNQYHLHWFTPLTEIRICGHGTLGSAYVLWKYGYENSNNPVHFHTRSGVLKTRLIEEYVQLEFPHMVEKRVETPLLLMDALNTRPKYIGKNSLDYLVELDSEEEVRALQPNISLIEKLPMRGVIVTSKSSSKQYDFVSRFFSPSQGIVEDSVNGSSHSCLGPYWKNKLNKHELIAHQCSERGGTLRLKVFDNKVYILGKVVPVLEGCLLV